MLCAGEKQKKDMTATARGCCLSCPNSMGLIRLTRFLSGLLYCQQVACPAVELCTKHRGLFSCSFLLGTAIIARHFRGVNAENNDRTKVSCYHDSFALTCKFFVNTPVLTAIFNRAADPEWIVTQNKFCSPGFGAGASTSRKPSASRMGKADGFSCLWEQRHCLHRYFLNMYSTELALMVKKTFYQFYYQSVDF